MGSGFNFLVFDSKELKMLQRSLSILQCYRDGIENKVCILKFKSLKFLKALGIPNVETYIKLSTDSLVRFSVSCCEGVNNKNSTTPAVRIISKFFYRFFLREVISKYVMIHE